MSSSFYHNYNGHQHPTPSNAQSVSSHRSRRAPRPPQNSHNKQLQRFIKKEEEAAAVVIYRHKLGLARSFDLEDDELFCPALLTEADLESINSSSSDRSSLSSGSPTNSPQSTQVNLSPNSSFSLNSNSNPYIPTGYQSQPTTLKLHQPAATRIRNAIPIVNPSTGSISSPPSSVSPARMQHQLNSRRW